MTNKYELRYPHYHSHEKLIWLLSKGDLVEIDGESYSVVDLYRSPIKGKKPQIKLRKVEPHPVKSKIITGDSHLDS